MFDRELNLMIAENDDDAVRIDARRQINRDPVDAAYHVITVLIRYRNGFIRI